jgi:cell division septum initiation protein DivIVA
MEKYNDSIVANRALTKRVGNLEAKLAEAGQGAKRSRSMVVAVDASPETSPTAARHSSKLVSKDKENVK